MGITKSILEAAHIAAARTRVLENTLRDIYDRQTNGSVKPEPKLNRNGFDLNLLDADPSPAYVVYQIGKSTGPKVSTFILNRDTSVETGNGNVSHTYVLGVAHAYKPPAEFIAGKPVKQISRAALKDWDWLSNNRGALRINFKNGNSTSPIQSIRYRSGKMDLIESENSWYRIND